MTIMWPGTVPYSCDINSLSEIDQDLLLRFKPSYGIEKLRRRTSMVVTMLKYTKVMTTTQWDALMSFYRLTCLNGSQAFQSNHPRTSAVINAQFTQMPTMKTLESSLVVQVAIELTLLPINAA